MTMAKGANECAFSIYIPRDKRDNRYLERLIKIGARRDRSVNYLLVEALDEYLKSEENSPAIDTGV